MLKRVVVSVILYLCSIAIIHGAEVPYEKGFEKEMDSTMICTKLPMMSDAIVRLSKIEVYPEYIEAYLSYAKEVGSVSLLTEPGVLTMYAMADKENHTHITILEIYASEAAYMSHIQSQHFQKYKQGTIHMVKSLELCDQIPVNSNSVIVNELH